MGPTDIDGHRRPGAHFCFCASSIGRADFEQKSGILPDRESSIPVSGGALNLRAEKETGRVIAVQELDRCPGDRLPGFGIAHDSLYRAASGQQQGCVERAGVSESHTRSYENYQIRILDAENG
jgi:hypothetical protein